MRSFYKFDLTFSRGLIGAIWSGDKDYKDFANVGKTQIAKCLAKYIRHWLNK